MRALAAALLCLNVATASESSGWWSYGSLSYWSYGHNNGSFDWGGFSGQYNDYFHYSYGDYEVCMLRTSNGLAMTCEEAKNDGECDMACNTATCEWDGEDCKHDDECAANDPRRCAVAPPSPALATQAHACAAECAVGATCSPTATTTAGT